MSFLAPINVLRRSGHEFARIHIALTVLGGKEVLPHPFLFDTGCAMTTVSEDIAELLGLPAGGSPITVGAAIGSGAGRVIEVQFRFPPDAISELDDEPVSSSWLVIGGRTNIALLCLLDVHKQFTISTDDDTM
jgi:hypothetical protein